MPVVSFCAIDVSLWVVELPLSPTDELTWASFADETRVVSRGPLGSTSAASPRSSL